MATPIPENRAAFTAAEVAALTGGALRTGVATQAMGVVTDTRAALEGKLFVALVGERFDGHAFVPQAIARGAAGVVVSREVGAADGAFVVRVPDTLAALGALGRAHRARWGGRVVAVGGSAGKTTTRAVVSALLAAAVGDQVAFQRGNLNNLVGVPMVLLAVAALQRVAVVELGTNELGEIPRLARIAAPDVAVVTLIDLEHTEGLGGLDAIEREEGALFAALGPAGVAVGNVDDERVARQLAACAAGQRVGYGTIEAASYRVLARRPEGAGAARLRLARPAGGPLEVTTALLGLPGALAVAGGLAAAEAALGRPLTATEVAAGLEGAALREPGRLVPLELTDGTLLLDDTYNANPGSVRSSIGVAQELARDRGARLVLVLGEMRELGALSVEEHRRLGAALAVVAPALVVGIAGDAVHLVRAAAAAGVEAAFAADVEGAAAPLRAGVRAGDVVLVKGSRSVGAERLVQGLAGAHGGPG